MPKKSKGDAQVRQTLPSSIPILPIRTRPVRRAAAAVATAKLLTEQIENEDENEEEQDEDENENDDSSDASICAIVSGNKKRKRSSPIQIPLFQARQESRQDLESPSRSVNDDKEEEEKDDDDDEKDEKEEKRKNIKKEDEDEEEFESGEDKDEGFLKKGKKGKKGKRRASKQGKKSKGLTKTNGSITLKAAATTLTEFEAKQAAYFAQVEEEELIVE